jgi:hypothetical protein
MALDRIKNTNPDPFKIVWQNFVGNTNNHLRQGKVTASIENQLSKTVDENLNYEKLKVKFKEQNERCYWLGIKLDPQDNYIKNHPLALSVDRLDITKPYTYDNIVISSRLMNLGRGRFNHEEFQKVVNERIKHEKISRA